MTLGIQGDLEQGSVTLGYASCDRPLFQTHVIFWGQKVSLVTPVMNFNCIMCLCNSLLR